MSGFYANGENFDRIFTTDFQLIDQFVGNRLLNTGVNTSGQLGDNTTVGKSSPIPIAGVGNNWNKISSGPSTVGGAGHAAAIKTDGTLWTWGSNNKGQLGGNQAYTVSLTSPTTTVSNSNQWQQVACGLEFTIAIRKNGTLWSWGSNSTGTLGTNTPSSVSRTSPTTVTAPTVASWKSVAAGGALLGATAKGIAAAVKNDGSLWTWGDDTYGQLGDGYTSPNKSSPTIVIDTRNISQGLVANYNWTNVAVGGAHMLGIRTDGSLWAWGSGVQGQLGNNNTVNRSFPVSVAGGNTPAWRNAAAGLSFSAGIKVDGTLWTWGVNNNTALGTGDATNVTRTSPTAIAGGGTTWKMVSCGYAHSLAVKTDGTLWGWGANTAGQLGDGTTVVKSTPVQVGGLSGWITVTTSSNGTAGSGSTVAAAFFGG